MPGAKVTLEGEGKFRVTSLVEDCDIIVSNLRLSEGSATAAEPAAPASGYTAGDPMDGWLDALITPRQGALRGMFRKGAMAARSVIPLRRLSVTSEEPIAVQADGRQFSHNVVSIEIVPDRLKVITGRERVFAPG